MGRWLYQFEKRYDEAHGQANVRDYIGSDPTNGRFQKKFKSSSIKTKEDIKDTKGKIEDIQKQMKD